MVNILNLTLEELEHFLVDTMGEKPFRARQIWQWIWNKYVHDFDQMTNVSKATRALLHTHARIVWPSIEHTRTSQDGTVKLLLRLEDEALVETVLIPGSRGRITQCLSCQVGCTMGCTFCATGKLGFERNMTMAEILGQVLVARAYLKDIAERPILRNVVFMGMGEPMLNLPEVMRSLRTLNDNLGLLFSPRRITVSTCGVNPQGLRTLGESGLAFLAVSLHAPTQALREQIMPKAAQWHLDDLMQSLRTYPLKARERITFEYLLLGEVNDSPTHARELVRLLSHTKAKLNLIVYNPSGDEHEPYQAPTQARIQAFEQYLWSKGITATLRKSKGADINAACGQLKAAAITA